ncbi:S1 RNA-binding domain-containing protein [Prosthecochloris sp. HL-130-GSB]|uniref:S1 RNA-binding domain-containing protein n=1 Tax=Prosthecochloris sp. HL-130-GSB TaxID=1974213 RepID=UPI0035148361
MPHGEGASAAVETIKTLISKPEVGVVYSGKVRDIREELGAFVEFLPKTDGLVHISEIAKERVSKVSDHLKPGDRIKVKLIDIRKDQRTGKTRYALSIKALEASEDTSEVSSQTTGR